MTTTTAPPRAESLATEGLMRSLPFAVRDGDAAGDGLTLDGYAAVFGQFTRIDSWEGTFDEQFRAGSFKKTLRERTPLMQYDHGRHPLIGSIPLGRFDSLAEDEQGLHVVGRLSDNWLIEPVRHAIADGGVTGMSIRFSVVRDEWRDVQGKLVKGDELLELLWLPGERGPLQRTIIEARLLEAGPVAWPAYEGTSVDVRSAELAQTVMRDAGLRHDVRHSLAAGRPTEMPAVPEDAATRAEVARALLFGSVMRAALGDLADTPGTVPPVERDDEDVTDAEAAGHTDGDAPPESGHPSAESHEEDGDEPEEGRSTVVDTDAPPPGHPSSEQTRAQYLRRAYMTRNRVGKIR